MRFPEICPLIKILRCESRYKGIKGNIPKIEGRGCRGSQAQRDTLQNLSGEDNKVIITASLPPIHFAGYLAAPL